MKKFLMLIVACAALGLSLVGFSSPASATGGGQIDGKPVTVCHATGSESNPFVKLTNVQLVQFFGQNGHAAHEGDIWAAFDYYTRDGHGDEWVLQHQAAQGDQSLLAFDDCTPPPTDEEIVKPEPTFNDPCGTKNDTFSVAGGRGYLVGAVVNNGLTKSITVTTADGFVFAGGDHSVTFSHDFTDVDCGLPDTGGTGTNTAGGIGALLGLVGVGVMTLVASRRRRSLI